MILSTQLVIRIISLAVSALTNHDTTSFNRARSTISDARKYEDYLKTDD